MRKRTEGLLRIVVLAILLFGGRILVLRILPSIFSFLFRGNRFR